MMPPARQFCNINHSDVPELIGRRSFRHAGSRKSIGLKASPNWLHLIFQRVRARYDAIGVARQSKRKHVRGFNVI